MTNPGTPDKNGKAFLSVPIEESLDDETRLLAALVHVMRDKRFFVGKNGAEVFEMRARCANYLAKRWPYPPEATE